MRSLHRQASSWGRIREWFTGGIPAHGADGGQNLQDDPLWCESEPHKVTSQ